MNFGPFPAIGSEVSPMRIALPRRGRVLRATFGCNPNSSSLGVDVTFLLFGATFASALALGLGALLRGSRSKTAAPPAAAAPERAP
jgi:hypothetical protein